MILDKIVRSVDELNAAAEHLRQSGGIEDLRKLAKAWNVPYVQTEDYIKGKRYRLMEVLVSDKEFRTYSEKLLEEMLILDDKYFASLIAWHIIHKCEGDGELGKMVLKKHKSLQKCLDFITSKAFKMATQQAKHIEQEGSQRNIGLALSQKEVFPWAEEYYQSDDKEVKIKRGEEEKEKIRKEWESRKVGEQTAASEAKKFSPKSRKETKKKETTKTEKYLKMGMVVGMNGEKVDTFGQLSLFEMAGLGGMI